jgi:hypothetical protein
VSGIFPKRKNSNSHSSPQDLTIISWNLDFVKKKEKLFFLKISVDKKEKLE